MNNHVTFHTHFIHQPTVQPKTSPATSEHVKTISESGKKNKSESFATHMQQAVRTESLTFSHHAQQRLQQRDIQLTVNQMQQLTNGVERAQAKGSKEALVLLDNLAFVVSVQNRTVITAMPNDALKDRIVTNIDSAVLVNTPAGPTGKPEVAAE